METKVETKMETKMILVNNINFLDMLEKKGKQIYSTNKHYHMLANVMEHPDFIKFYNTYFKDEDSIQLILKFMKAYDDIGKLSSDSLNAYQKLTILKNVFDNGHTRRLALNGGIGLSRLLQNN